jgi:2-polyprenyl-3-methyl-5-hydroxy-6-metoxy-1,4-benzoquinol methylase
VISPGHYARKQLFSRSRLVTWSHSSRFETARALVGPRAGGRLLDYGCGDGTFLALVADLFPVALGVDVTPDQIEDCAHRFASAPGIAFALTDEIRHADHVAIYDVVVCMEVLDHCPDDVQRRVLDDLQRVGAPGGLIVCRSKPAPRCWRSRWRARSLRCRARRSTRAESATRCRS